MQLMCAQNDMQPTLNHFKCFIVASEEGSFRKAALRLQVDPSVVSRAIQIVENDVGAELFKRIPGQGARLTEVGVAYAIEIDRIFDYMCRAKKAAQTIAFGSQGLIRLAISQDISGPILANALADHQEKFPNLKVDLLELAPADQVRSLRMGEVDIAIMLNPPNDRSMVVERVWIESCKVALAEDHWLAGHSDLSAADLDQEKIILGHPTRGPFFGEFVLSILQARQVHLETVARVERVETLLMLVDAHRGIAFVPGTSYHECVGGITYRSVNLRESDINVFAVLPTAEPPGLVGQFLNSLRSMAEKLQN
ncbi:LysR family transcriptional regulator [Paroceanicella profunda]|uniref:LysR family transcriptional regulator n=2 Tax=Paroceanicella profunda TaxID=2579971 RepID=A0A5B8G1P5_9RHOB|nr:LysR family transcriptional regulator [Paroceanicella profunda]